MGTLNISGIAILNNTISCLSSLNISGNTTINSNLNILGKVYAVNLPNVSNFLISFNTTCTVGSSSYYKYDIDLTKYTTYITPSASVRAPTSYS